MQDEIKTVVDAVAMTTTISTLLGWMPVVAAALSIIWTALRIWETKTIQGLFNKRRVDTDS